MKELFDCMSREKKVNTGKLIVAGVIGGTMVLAGIAALCFINKKKKRMDVIEMGVKTDENN